MMFCIREQSGMSGMEAWDVRRVTSFFPSRSESVFLSVRLTFLDMQSQSHTMMLWDFPHFPPGAEGECKYCYLNLNSYYISGPDSLILIPNAPSFPLTRLHIDKACMEEKINESKKASTCGMLKVYLPKGNLWAKSVTASRYQTCTIQWYMRGWRRKEKEKHSIYWKNYILLHMGCIRRMRNVRKLLNFVFWFKVQNCYLSPKCHSINSRTLGD